MNSHSYIIIFLISYFSFSKSENSFGTIDDVLEFFSYNTQDINFQDLKESQVENCEEPNIVEKKELSKRDCYKKLSFKARFSEANHRVDHRYFQEMK